MIVKDLEFINRVIGYANTVDCSDYSVKEFEIFERGVQVTIDSLWSVLNESGSELTITIEDEWDECYE